MEKDIDVLRVGNVELRRKKVEWKLWRINRLKSYLMERKLWDIVESVNRKTLTKLIEKGILTEEELKGMYDQYFTNWIRKSSIPITISNI